MPDDYTGTEEAVGLEDVASEEGEVSEVRSSKILKRYRFTTTT